MSTWLVILAVGAGTYLLRASMFLALAGRTLPQWTERPMNLVGPAAMAALVATMTFTSAGSATMPDTATAAAILAGFLAVRRTGNVMHAFIVGLPVFWIVGALAV
jgi:branched-subunit amino acid transport protein